MISQSPLNRKSIVVQLFGDQGMAYFWERRFLPRWLPLLLGLGLGVFTASLVADEAWHLAVPVVLLVPAVILFSRYPFVAIMIWMAVFPFFVRTPTAAARKVYWMLHRGMIPVALGSTILSHWLGVRRRKKLVRMGPAELAMAIFVGLGLVNVLLLNRNPVPKLYHLYDRLFVPFCMYWLVRLTAPKEKDLKRFLWVAFFTVLIQSAIGLLSWFAPQVLPPYWLGLQGARTVGTFGNAAVYSTTLILLSLLLFQYAMHCRRGRIRAVLLFVFSLAFFCVFFTFSRGSWLGGSVVLLGLMLLYPKVTVRLTIVVTVFIFILSSSVLANEVAWAWERFNTENTAEGRLLGYNASIGMIKTKPLFGWGYGNYDLYDRRFQTRVGNIAVGQDKTSHNTYLTLMVEVGLIAFLFYVFPMGYWLGISIKTWQRLPRDGFGSWRLLIMLWLLMIDHVIVSNFMDMVRFNKFGTTVWWMAMGLIANMVYPRLGPGNAGVQGWTRLAK